MSKSNRSRSVVPKEPALERRRFYRIRSMVQYDQPMAQLIQGVAVDYYRCWQAEQTDSYITFRKTRATVEHHPPGDPLRIDLDRLHAGQLVERPFTFRILYTFCKEHADLFSPAQRAIIDLYYGEGYTEAQIGHQIGISQSAASCRVQNVRKRLLQIAKGRGRNDATQ